MEIWEKVFQMQTLEKKYRAVLAFNYSDIWESENTQWAVIHAKLNCCWFLNWSVNSIQWSIPPEAVSGICFLNFRTHLYSFILCTINKFVYNTSFISTCYVVNAAELEKGNGMWEFQWKKNKRRFRSHCYHAEWINQVSECNGRLDKLTNFLHSAWSSRRHIQNTP